MGSITITYVGEGRRPLSIAVVNDRALLRMAAGIAIREAEAQADSTSRLDPMMGRLQCLEVVRLRAALGALVPDL
jgi:hypothetical protein